MGHVLTRAKAILTRTRAPWLHGVGGLIGACLAASVVVIAGGWSLDLGLGLALVMALATVGAGEALARRHRPAVAAGVPVVATGLAVGLALALGAQRLPGLLLLGLATAAGFLGARHVVLPRVLGAVPTARAPTWLRVGVLGLLTVQMIWAAIAIASPASGPSVLPTMSHHSCLAAYLRAGELALDGVANPYAPGLYAPDAVTAVRGMESSMRDPFMYPPTALLAPAAAVATGASFGVLQALWLCVQVGVLGTTALLVAGAMPATSPRDQARQGLLSLAMVASFPAMAALLFGQAHVFVICLSMLAMLAFERGRNGWGGALLAVAIGTKLFPGVLLVYLLGRRRFRALGAVLLAGLALTLVSLIVVGAAPFAAYFDIVLPRLVGGEAFATFTDAPGFDAVHLGFAGLALSLEQLGLDVPPRLFAAPYLAAATLVAYRFGRAHARLARPDPTEPIAWLAVVSLAATAALYVPATYGALPPLWLALLLAARHWDRPRRRLLLGGAALVLCFAPFVGYLPGLYAIPNITTLASLVCAGLAAALGFAPAWLASSPPQPPLNPASTGVPHS